MTTPYQKFRPEEPGFLLLDANERLGLLDKSQCATYPNAAKLEAIIADNFAITPDRVLVTAGADEAIDRFCRTMLSCGKNIVIPQPTFEMLPRYARLANAEVKEVSWLTPEFPFEEFCAAVDENTRAVALITPNNPTGLVIPQSMIVEIATRYPRIPILLDLAYVEFARLDPTAIALTLPNIVVTRTFSKAYGLAGLRVGYALGSPELIARMRATGSPYPVSATSLDIAQTAFVDANAEMSRYIKRVAEERTALTRILTDNGALCLPSETNFVFAIFSNAAGVAAHLRREKILVREFSDERIANALRITCPGDETLFDRLCKSLRGAK